MAVKDFKALFTVDAADMLVKLHLAGRAASKGYDEKTSFIANSGVVDDNLAAKPDSPGKVKFDLKSGTYVVGFVTDFVYHKVFGAKELLSQLKEKNASLGKEPIDATSSDPKVKKALEEIKIIGEKLQSYFPDLAKEGIFKDKDTQLNDGQLKTIDEIVSKALEADAAATKQKRSAAIGEAQTALASYFGAFAGADNAKNVTAKSIGVVQVSNAVKAPSSQDLFDGLSAVKQIDDAEAKKLIAQWRESLVKNPKKDNGIERVCFYVTYDVEAGK